MFISKQCNNRPIIQLCEPDKSLKSRLRWVRGRFLSINLTNLLFSVVMSFETGCQDMLKPNSKKTTFPLNHNAQIWNCLEALIVVYITSVV